MERAVILSPGKVFRSPLTELKRPVSETATRRRTLGEVERDTIVQTLQETNWVIGGPNGAATRLGLPRTSLIYKMQKHDIRRPWKLTRTRRFVGRPSQGSRHPT